MRKEGNKRCKVDKIACGWCLAPVNINQITDGVKDVERQTDGKQHAGEFNRVEAQRVQSHVEAVDTEVGVLEIAQSKQVQGHTGRE